MRLMLTLKGEGRFVQIVGDEMFELDIGHEFEELQTCGVSHLD